MRPPSKRKVAAKLPAASQRPCADVGGRAQAHAAAAGLVLGHEVGAGRGEGDGVVQVLLVQAQVEVAGRGGLQGEGRLGAGHGLRPQRAHQVDGLQVDVAHDVVADAVAALGEHQDRRGRLEGAAPDQLGHHLVAPLVDRSQAPARLQGEGAVPVAHAIDPHVGVEAQPRQGVGGRPAAGLERQADPAHQLIAGVAGADEIEAVARPARADRLEEGLPVEQHVLPVELAVEAGAQGEPLARRACW